MIATGEYDGYVAEPRACEWDIAAGHEILKHSVGSIVDFEGNVKIPLDIAQARDAIIRLKKKGAESLAVVLLFSFLIHRNIWN